MPRNLRDLLLASAALLVDDGAPDPAAGGGGDTQPAPVTPDPVAGDPPADAGAGDPPAGDPPADPDPKPARVPWQTKRIDQLTAERRTAEETAQRVQSEKDALAAEVAAYKALHGELGDPAAAAPAARPGTRVYTDVEMQAEAARIANITNLNNRCEDLFRKGSSAHATTWNARLNAAGQAFGDQLRQRPDFFEALTALPNGEDVYHSLCGDLDHLNEVLGMAPVTMGMELAKMSTTAAASPRGPKVSNAPAPIETVGGGLASDSVDLSNMDNYAKDFDRRRLDRAKARGLA